MATPTADISQLSESQQAALQQLLAVTGQEVGQAVPLLQRSQWSVEVGFPDLPFHPLVLILTLNR